MEITALATTVVGLLAPHLPKLWQLGTKLAEGAATKAGENISEGVSKLWNRIFSKSNEQPNLKTALEDLAKNNQDQDLQAVLRVELARIFRSDPRWMQDVLGEVGHTEPMNVTQNVTGDKNIVVGRDINLDTFTQQ